jgi:hypothetical protein
MTYFFQKQIILAVSALLLAAAGAPAQVLSPVYSLAVQHNSLVNEA